MGVARFYYKSTTGTDSAKHCLPQTWMGFPFRLSKLARRLNIGLSICACLIGIVALSCAKVDPIDSVVKEESSNPRFPSGLYKPSPFRAQQLQNRLPQLGCAGSRTKPPPNPSLNCCPIPSPTPQQVQKACGWVLVGTIAYWVCSEGSRILFPPRNLIPVP